MISKVQQRGVGATKEVLMQLLDGMHEQNGQKVLVVDMNPSRLDCFHVNNMSLNFIHVQFDHKQERKFP